MAFSSGSDESASQAAAGQAAPRTAAEVARIRELLWEVVAFERSRVAQRMPRNGLIVAGIGALVGVWPLIVAAIGALVLLGDGDWEWGDLLLALAYFRLAVQLVAFCVSAQGACGFALLAAGLGFRQGKEWARRTIVVVLWLAIGYGLAFGLFGMVAAAQFQARSGGFYPLLCAIPIVVAFWVGLFWPPLRYFSSAAVRAVCRGGAALADTNPPWPAPPVR